MGSSSWLQKAQEVPLWRRALPSCDILNSTRLYQTTRGPWTGFSQISSLVPLPGMPASQDVDFSRELTRNRHRVHLITTKLGASWGRGPRLQTWVRKLMAWKKFTDPFWAPPLLPAPAPAISPSLPPTSFSSAFSCSRLKKTIEAWQLILTLHLLLGKRLAYTFGRLTKLEYALLKLKEGVSLDERIIRKCLIS